MFDTFGRTISYLRMSVTNQCNYHCLYCRPYSDRPSKEFSPPLQREPLVHLARLFVECGIEKIRLTGGEPLLRKDLCEIIFALRSIPRLKEICLTTNGHFLSEQIESLVNAGLQRINVSLDTLSPDTLQRISRNGELALILNGIEKAQQLLPGKVKLNVVLLRNVNEKELAQFASMTMDQDIDVRFIEHMPIDDQDNNAPSTTLSVTEAKETINKTYSLIPINEHERNAGPAEHYRIPGAKGRIGFIGAVTNHFCHRCNRVRLSCDGKMSGCLYDQRYMDLRELLETGASDVTIKTAIEHAMQKKSLIRPQEKTRLNTPRFSMAQIGG